MGRNTVTCDFCGKDAPAVRRIAMDSGYDRLTVKHDIKYACEECSRKKELERATRGSTS